MVRKGSERLRILCIPVICGGLASAAWGGGFQIPTQSARAAGQADAFTAQADDPSAIYYNPAGLTQFRGTQLSAGLYAVFPGFRFEGDAVSDEGNNTPAYIPHFYASTDLGLANWRFGLGVNSVFGLSENWGENGALRQIVTDADLNVLNIAPAVACRLGDHFSLGAALNVYYGTLELNSKIPLPAGPEGDFRIEGEDVAVGVTVGTLWKINEKHSLGLVYRSPFSLAFDGASRIELPGGLPMIGPSDTSAGVEFPQIIVAGYAFRPTDRLTLEADVQWADWETLNDVRVESADPRFSSLPPRSFDFTSSFTYRFGVQYQLDRNWTVRGGYIYSPTSSPGDTFTPVVVDLDSHVLTAGLGYTQPKWAVDVAYRFIYGAQRDINHSVNSPPGDYSDETQAVIVTLTLKF